MNALILAGGLATRLRPLTDKIPKALVPVSGKPFLLYQLEYLKSQGIGEVVLLTGYQSQKIQDEFGDGKKMGLMIEYQVESSPLGTGGALIQGRRYVGKESLVMNGDTYFEFEISKLLDFHRKKKSLMTLGVAKKQMTGQDYGTITLDPDGRVRDFSEKTESGPFLNAGFYILSQGMFSQFPLSEGPSSLERDVIPAWVKKGAPVYGYEFNHQNFYDIGTPDRLKTFESHIRKVSHAH